jgi:hypothetical protein
MLRAADHASELDARFDSETDGEVRFALREGLDVIHGAPPRKAGRTRPRGRVDPAEILRTFADAQGPGFVAILPDALDLGRTLWLHRGRPKRGERLGDLAGAVAAADARQDEAVPALIGLLGDADPRVRAGAARTLRYFTNHADDIDWIAGSEEALRRGRERWHSLWAEHGGAARRDWVIFGFQQAGYKVPMYEQEHAWELVRAIGGPDHVSFNAQQTLIKLFGHRPVARGWSRGDACRYWMNWLEPRWKRYGMSSPPGRVVRACREADAPK